MKIEIPASVTYSQYPRKSRYKWKYGNNVSIYTKIEKRCVLRIAISQFGKKVSELERKDRQVNINFSKLDMWRLEIERTKEHKVTLTTHIKDSKHIWLQVILNQIAPKEFIEPLRQRVNKQGSVTIPIRIKLDLNEWGDINLQYSDFLYHTEIHAKNLLTYVMDKGFTVNYIPKGREYDVELINPYGIKLAIAISSHNAKSNTRSKQHRVQKALIDIAKMMPSLHKDNKIKPVILTQPFEFDGSWNFVGNNYIQFYKDVYGFKFISTDFKKGWEKRVCEELRNIKH